MALWEASAERGEEVELVVVTGVAGDVRMPLLVTAATTEDLFSTGDALCDDKLFSSEMTETFVLAQKICLEKTGLYYTGKTKKLAVHQI